MCYMCYMGARSMLRAVVSLLWTLYIRVVDVLLTAVGIACVASVRYNIICVAEVCLRNSLVFIRL